MLAPSATAVQPPRSSASASFPVSSFCVAQGSSTSHWISQSLHLPDTAPASSIGNTIRSAVVRLPSRKRERTNAASYGVWQWSNPLAWPGFYWIKRDGSRYVFRCLASFWAAALDWRSCSLSFDRATQNPPQNFRGLHSQSATLSRQPARYFSAGCLICPSVGPIPFLAYSSSECSNSRWVWGPGQSHVSLLKKRLKSCRAPSHPIIMKNDVSSSSFSPIVRSRTTIPTDCRPGHRLSTFLSSSES